MVNLTNLFHLGLNASPGLIRTDAIQASSEDASDAVGHPRPPVTVANNVRDVAELTNDSKLARSSEGEQDDMVEVPESRLEDMLDEIKDLEGQVEAMMSSDSGQDPTIAESKDNKMSSGDQRTGPKDKETGSEPGEEDPRVDATASEPEETTSEPEKTASGPQETASQAETGSNPKTSSKDEGAGSEDEADECQADDMPLDSRGEVEVSGSIPRRANCTPGSAAGQKFLEVSNSEASGGSSDESADETRSSSATTTSPATAETSVTSDESTTASFKSATLPAGVGIATEDVYHYSSIDGPVLFTDKFDTTVLTSTRKSTKTITQTRTRVVSLTQSSTPPVVTPFSEDDDNYTDGDDTQQKEVEGDEEAPEQGEEETPAPMATNVPLRVGFVQTYSNSTVTGAPPVAPVVPASHKMPPTPAPEVRAVVVEEPSSTSQKFVIAVRPDAAKREPTLSGFKTVIRPGEEESGRTTQ